MKKIFILLLHYEDYENAKKSLLNIQKLKIPKNVNTQIVLIDNKSNKKELTKLKEIFPKILTLPLKKNYGFTGGFNKGLKYAHKNNSDYVLMVSPDLEMKTTVLIELFNVMEKNETIGAACSKVLIKSKPSRIFFVGGVLEKNRKTSIHIGFNEIDRGQYDNMYGFDFLNLPLLVRGNILRKVGYLKEEYFLYYEDIDWYARIKRSNMKLVCVNKAITWNKNPELDSSHNFKKAYYTSRNYLYFLLSNFSFLTIFIALIYEVKEIALMIKKIFQKPKDVKNKIEFYQFLGIKDFLLGVKGYKKIL